MFLEKGVKIVANVRNIVYLHIAIDTKAQKMKANYRIQNHDRTLKNVGTDLPSWFTLEDARKEVDYEKGQRIVEHDGMNILWEIF